MLPKQMNAFSNVNPLVKENGQIIEHGFLLLEGRDWPRHKHICGVILAQRKKTGPGELGCKNMRWGILAQKMKVGIFFAPVFKM